MKLRRGSKTARMLALFAAGRALNRFEAERLGDHVLPSTVFALQTRCGLVFTRKAETVPGFGDSTVRCARYSLTADQQNRARALLGSET